MNDSASINGSVKQSFGNMWCEVGSIKWVIDMLEKIKEHIYTLFIFVRLLCVKKGEWQECHNM